ncbi:MAG: hypothetical protein V3U62_03730 [Sedimenticolaceae bacterium]
MEITICMGALPDETGDVLAFLAVTLLFHMAGYIHQTTAVSVYQEFCASFTDSFCFIFHHGIGDVWVLIAKVPPKPRYSSFPG